jgi:hypothetical protein
LQVVQQRRYVVVGGYPTLDGGYLFELFLGLGGVVPQAGFLSLQLLLFEFYSLVIDVKDASSANPVALQAL